MLLLRMLVLLTAGFWLAPCLGQPITGVWRGKVLRGLQVYKLELKLVKKGDSLLGTSYYYANAANYYRYGVKGYFDATDNAVHWWDDTLLAYKTSGGILSLGFLKNQPLQSAADFNCPGGGVMRLDGTAENDQGTTYELHVQKSENGQFADEWDPVIEGYFYGMADPNIIDSVAQLARAPTTQVPTPSPTLPLPQKPVVAKPTPAPPVAKVKELPSLPPTSQPSPPVIAQTIAPPPAPTITEKYQTRKKETATTIPFSGDSIVLQFYDNAEVDGDSISLFLNDTLLVKHVRLTASAYTITIATKNLGATTTLTMVAENLGSIPPNTSFMLAYDGEKRYSARLESTENSSAVIVLQRQTQLPKPSP